MTEALPLARMPTWFIPHGGGPCCFMGWNPIDAWDRMADFLKNASRSLPRQPKAYLHSKMPSAVLMTVAGAAGNSVGRKVFSDRVMQTTLSAFTFSS